MCKTAKRRGKSGIWSSKLNTTEESDDVAKHLDISRGQPMEIEVHDVISPLPDPVKISYKNLLTGTQPKFTPVFFRRKKRVVFAQSQVVGPDRFILISLIESGLS